MQTYRRLLIIGWILLCILVALCFVSPLTMARFHAASALLFVLLPSILLIATGVYRLAQLYRVGMSRSRR